jgi:endonuclease YncB( thermonuclease family)
MLRPTGLLKRAFLRGALFAFWFALLAPALAWAADCLAFRADEWVTPVYVYDGDTLKLEDGRKLRLLGINTPEIGRDGTPSEALAHEARQALVDLVAQQPRLALRYEQQRQDRYGRLLAHAFLSDGRNLQQLLLQRGLAAAVAIAPNLANFDCYLAAEDGAQGQGIWRLPEYQGIATTALPSDAGGFRVVQGRVKRVGESRQAYWLNFAGGFAARIDKRDLPRFARVLDVDQLQGRTLKLRGWLYQVRGQTRLNLYHPRALQLLPSGAGPVLP